MMMASLVPVIILCKVYGLRGKSILLMVAVLVPVFCSGVTVPVFLLYLTNSFNVFFS